MAGGSVTERHSLCAPLVGAEIKAFLVKGSGARCSKIIKVHILDLASLHLVIYPKEGIVAGYSRLAKGMILSALFVTVKFETNKVSKGRKLLKQILVPSHHRTLVAIQKAAFR